jgi:hypothetical protein
MSLIFPSNPTLNQTYQTGSSATYRWNGTFWVVSTPPISGLTVATASYAERVVWMQTTPPPTGTGSLWYDADTGNMYVKYDASWVPAQSTIGNAVSSSFTTTATSASFATTSSHAVSASALIGSQATYLYTQKTATQTITSASVTTLTTWGSPVISINAGEWNGTTGVFTATKAGLYEVSAVLQMGNETYAFAGGEIGLLILINGSSIGVGRWFVPTASYSGLPPSIYASALVNLSVGTIVSVAVSNFSGASRTTFTNGTFITIKELPTRIQR